MSSVAVRTWDSGDFDTRSRIWHMFILGWQCGTVLRILTGVLCGVAKFLLSNVIDEESEAEISR
jgi:hypothetical protein